MEKDISCKWERKKTGASILISGKTDFKIKSITKDKGGPTSFTSEYLSKEIQNTNSQRHIHPYVHCSTISNSQNMEAAYMSIDKVDKKDVVHIYNGILFSHKKNEILLFVTDNMDGPRGYYAK